MSADLANIDGSAYIKFNPIQHMRFKVSLKDGFSVSKRIVKFHSVFALYSQSLLSRLCRFFRYLFQIVVCI